MEETGEYMLDRTRRRRLIQAFSGERERRTKASSLEGV